MIVRCIANTLADVPESFIEESAGYGRSASFPLTVGKEYWVEAITTSYGGFWFYILDDDGFPYPMWHPSAIFEVSDPTIPSNWVIGHHKVYGNEITTVISYPAWANDPFYYERLYDEEASALQEFRHQIDARG